MSCSNDCTTQMKTVSRLVTCTKYLLYKIRLKLNSSSSCWRCFCKDGENEIPSRVSASCLYRQAKPPHRLYTKYGITTERYQQDLIYLLVLQGMYLAYVYINRRLACIYDTISEHILTVLTLEKIKMT
jgi:hypothetical protein